MERKIRHHIIPRFYLAGFCDEQGMVWTYHKDLAVEQSCQKPERTAFVNNFYSIERNDGTIDTNTFEDALAEIIESPAKKALETLRSLKNPDSEDRQRLALLFSFQLVRTPVYRKFYEKQHNKEFNLILKNIARNKEGFQKWADDYKKLNNETLASNIEKLRKEILNNDYKVEIHPNYSLKIMNRLAASIAYILADMNWLIIETSDELPFLISDNPIIVTNENSMGYYQTGLLDESVRIFIPVSKKVCLLMIHTEGKAINNQVIKENKKIVKEINRATVLIASRFIYSSKNDNKIVKMIQNANSKLKTNYHI